MSGTSRQEPLRVAMFPRGVDGVFLPKVEGVEIYPLVERGSPEEIWAQELFDPARLLRYTLRRSDLGPYPSTEAILRSSDVHAQLTAREPKALFLGVACSARTLAWANEHGVRLLMTDYLHQRHFEDKIWFDGFLRRHGIPRPAGGPLAIRRARPFPRRGRAVVQAPDSTGGEGTYFVRGPEDVRRLLDEGALAEGQRYLSRAFIEGKPYGITVFVAPGSVSLSAVRLQCYYPAAGDAAVRAFAGVQWVPTGSLPPRLRRRIDEVFLRLGELLYRRRFFGFANIDFMVDARLRVFVLECNARMSAATPQVLRYPELLSGAPVFPRFFQGFTAPRRFPRAFERSPLPGASYRGSTLDIVHVHARGEPPAVVTRGFASGLYALGPSGVSYRGPDVRRLAGPDELCLFSYARPGQACAGEVTLASVVSNIELYDDQGELLPPARQILAYFRYFDDRQRHCRQAATD